jgi:2-dehydropantoate 2-reductase
MRMIVIGAGPIGRIIGGRLARAGNDMTFVAIDGEHVAAIRHKGLQVDVPDGSFNAKIPCARFKEVSRRKSIIRLRMWSGRENGQRLKLPYAVNYWT